MISTGTGTVISGGRSTTTYNAAADASWAPDIWGKIRRQVESDVATSQADAAELANATLSAQSELAIDYMTLRVLDEEKRLYDQTVSDYKRSLQITQNQYNAGVAARGDVITAQTQLLATQAQDADIGVQRAQNEHAIALLIGVAPGRPGHCAGSHQPGGSGGAGGRALDAAAAPPRHRPGRAGG